MMGSVNHLPVISTKDVSTKWPQPRNIDILLPDIISVLSIAPGTAGNTAIWQDLPADDDNDDADRPRTRAIPGETGAPAGEVSSVRAADAVRSTTSGQLRLGPRGFAVASWLAPAVVIGGITARRWWQEGGLPTGLDGGQWLALGRGFFGRGRSTAGAYPPLIPLIVDATRTFVDPMTALRLIASGSLLAILIAVYLIARDGLGPWFAVPVTAIIGLSSALTEPAAFGGYPQQLAFACLLLAAWCLAHYLTEGRGRYLAGTATTLSGAALTHLIYFPLALATVGSVWMLWLTTRPRRTVILRRSLYAAIAAIASLACSLPTLLAFWRAGYAPPLAASGLSLSGAFRYGTREAPWFWGTIVAGGLLSVAVTWPRRVTPVWLVAASLAVISLPLFLVTAEVRLLPPLLTGACLMAGFGLQRLEARLRRLPWSVLPLIATIAAPVLLWPRADAAATAYYRYYRVVDPSLLNAAQAVRAHDPGGVVAVRHDRRGWPIGWWFEGLTETRIAVGADDRWLGFPSERDAAHLAGQFFGERLTGMALTDLARRTGVEMLVFRKWEWIGWQRWLADPEPVVTIVYDDDQFMVLAIRRDQASGPSHARE